MPEENRWRKAHDSDAGIGGFMEEDIDNSNTDTIPIPLLDVETKTVPVFCPWCEEISGVAKADVARFAKISPAYKACGKCKEFINKGKVFLGRSSSPIHRLISFWQQMCAYRRK